MLSDQCVYLQGNENVIRAYPSKVLASYYWLKYRRSGGIIYQGFDEHKLQVFNWKHRAFYHTMASLVKHGLATKDEFGNWKLTTFDDLIRRHNDGRKVKHKCSIKMWSTMTLQDVQDQLKLKLFEEKLRQVNYAEANADRMKSKMDKGSQTGFDPMGKLNTGLLEFRRKGYTAASGKTLAKGMGVSVPTYHGWKKRMRNVISQVKRKKLLSSAEASKAMLENLDLVQQALKCAVFKTKIGWMMVQPNLYRVNQSYDKPVRHMKVFPHTPCPK